MRIFYKGLLIALVAMMCNVGMAQVPEKPDSMMPIIDLAGIIKNDALVNELNTRLDSLSRRTTNQIVVVTVNDLGKLEANQFATQLGKKWGIGGKKSNNGLIILVKPKNDNGPGEVYIAPGPGLEGALPDVKCRQIVDSIMVPHLKEGDYASGIEEAINHIEPIVIAEYEQAQAAHDFCYEDDTNDGGNGWWILGGIAAAIGGLTLLRKRNKKNLPPQPADGNQAAAGAATALAATAPQEEPVEEEPVEEEPVEKEPQEKEGDDDTKPDEPEPYK